MRRLPWLVGLPFGAIIVVFALSNRETVVVALWPFVDGLAMPLYLAELLSLLAGFLIGVVFQSLRGRRRRKRAAAAALSSPTAP